MIEIVRTDPDYRKTSFLKITYYLQHKVEWCPYVYLSAVLKQNILEDTGLIKFFFSGNFATGPSMYGLKFQAHGQVLSNIKNIFPLTVTLRQTEYFKRTLHRETKF